MFIYLEAVGILTSTVIECYKSGLTATALTACFTVMKPEYRSTLNPDFYEKFEFIVRKYGKGDVEDIEDLISPCPNCDADMPNYDLFCSECHVEIPFCLMSVSINQLLGNPKSLIFILDFYIWLLILSFTNF